MHAESFCYASKGFARLTIKISVCCVLSSHSIGSIYQTSFWKVGHLVFIQVVNPKEIIIPWPPVATALAVWNRRIKIEYISQIYHYTRWKQMNYHRIGYEKQAWHKTTQRGSCDILRKKKERLLIWTINNGMQRDATRQDTINAFSPSWMPPPHVPRVFMIGFGWVWCTTANRKKKG